MGCLNGLSFLNVKYKTKTAKQTNKPPLLCCVAEHGRVKFGLWTSTGDWSFPTVRCLELQGCRWTRAAQSFSLHSPEVQTLPFSTRPSDITYLLNSKSIAPALPSCCGSMFIFSRCASFVAFGLLSGADVSTCDCSSWKPYSIALTLIWAFAKL